MGNPGSVPHRMPHFRTIRFIRFRTSRGSQTLFFTMILVLFPGIEDLFLVLNLKPKENQCVWHRTLKNLGKIKVLGPWGPGPKGVLAEPGTPTDSKSHLFVTNWVAIQPFCTFAARLYAEFRHGSRPGGRWSLPLNPNFVLTLF